MKPTAKTHSLVFSLLLICSAFAANAAAADEIFERRFSVSDPLVLDVETGSGSIEIRSGAADEVIVTGRIEVHRRFLWGKPRNADEIVQDIKDNPPVEMDGSRLRVTHVKSWKLRNKVSIDYEITIPENAKVIAEAGSGSITVTDVAAYVDVHAGSGSLKLENISGDIKARTGSGSIRAEGVAGAFNAKSGSGSIHLEQIESGDVVVSTGSGSSTLNGIAGSVHASAGSGRISIDGRPEGDWKLDTGSGSVHLTLPSDAAFELDAETGSGGINVDHPLTPSGKISKKRVVGTVRGGGPTLLIDTGSGGIRIR